MWKFILLAVAAFVLYKFFMNDKLRKSKDESKSRERKIATGEMVRDPECGAYVEAESSISVRDGKTTHRFCSYECRQKFLDKLADSGREVPQLDRREDE